MPWTGSGWQGSWFWLSLTQTLPHRLAADPARVAAYDDSVSPAGSTAMSGYGSGDFDHGEVSSAAGWPAGGMLCPLTLPAGPAALLVLRAAPVTSAGPCAMVPYGSMLYDTIDQPPSAQLTVCFHDFGGPVPVNGGTFTIAWDPVNGVAVMEVPLKVAP
jgi:hypothetical protein